MSKFLKFHGSNDVIPIIRNEVKMESFSQEALMIELGQMPPQFVLEQIKEKNITEEEEQAKQEVYNLLNAFQAWSWV